jgi:hypothetical protein
MLAVAIQLCLVYGTVGLYKVQLSGFVSWW